MMKMSPGVADWFHWRLHSCSLPSSSVLHHIIGLQHSDAGLIPETCYGLQDTSSCDTREGLIKYSYIYTEHLPSTLPMRRPLPGPSGPRRWEIQGQPKGHGWVQQNRLEQLNPRDLWNMILSLTDWVLEWCFISIIVALYNQYTVALYNQYPQYLEVWQGGRFI